MNATIVGLIVVPLAIFLLGAVFGGVRGAIRFAQYLVRSEEAQDRMATAIETVATELHDFMGETRDITSNHSEQLAVLQWELNQRNGVPNAGPRPSTKSR